MGRRFDSYRAHHPAPLRGEDTITVQEQWKAIAADVVRHSIVAREEDLNPTDDAYIRAYGTEIRADMVWWRSTYAELAGSLKEARDHVHDPARRLHLISPVSVEISADRAEALSHFQITRTDPDGVSSIYVAGRYIDSLVKANGCWLYDRYRAVLDTRMLDSFTHLPL